MTYYLKIFLYSLLCSLPFILIISYFIHDWQKLLYITLILFIIIAIGLFCRNYYNKKNIEKTIPYNEEYLPSYTNNIITHYPPAYIANTV
jgi:c-di-AMP phosphodiesterase-like protein